MRTTLHGHKDLSHYQLNPPPCTNPRRRQTIIDTAQANKEDSTGIATGEEPYHAEELRRSRDR